MDPQNDLVRRDLSNLAYSALRAPIRSKTKEHKFAGPQTSTLFRASVCLQDERLFDKIVERGFVTTLFDFDEMGCAALLLDIDFDFIQ